VLVKALPQPSEKYTETVCVAALTAQGHWRRLYPVRFRLLQNGFHRWQWVEYSWKLPRDDRRAESRNVDGESIKPLHMLKPRERVSFLNPRIRNSTEEAAANGESLTLIRPRETRFTWEKKTENELSEERQAYQQAARQRSFLDTDEELKALEPCPYKFFFTYRTSDGKSHRNFCHDWETSATFYNLRKGYGADGALQHLDKEFNERYPAQGIAFAMGTHSQRPSQWLLVGVIRLDEDTQGSLGI
jgi:hypothetical protein